MPQIISPLLWLSRLNNYPSKKKDCPNYKVDLFFHWLCHIWSEAWVLRKNCLVEKQTCKMQGRSEYKTRCGKFKWLGDRMWTDCIYVKNEPVPKKWMQKGFFPWIVNFCICSSNFLMLVAITKWLICSRVLAWQEKHSCFQIGYFFMEEFGSQNAVFLYV